MRRAILRAALLRNSRKRVTLSADDARRRNQARKIYR